MAAIPDCGPRFVEGNPDEESKREACWKEFLNENLPLPSEWEAELSQQSFVAANSVEEALEAEWERIRHDFMNDSRTVGGLEALTGKIWVVNRRGDPVYLYAEKSWDQLAETRGMGLRRLRGLVEICAAASNI